MDIDRPLEELIDEKRAERRKSSTRGRGGRGRGRGGAARGGATMVVPVATVTPAAAGVGPVRNKYSGSIASANTGGKVASPSVAVPLMADGAKVIVSNLPMDVTENQVRDLFSQTVGPVTRLSLSYDKNGKSTGVATIDLKRPGDAQVAFQQYNGRLVDGTRPMKVEILFDPTRLPPPPLNARIAPAAVVQSAPAVIAVSGAPKAARGGAGGPTRGGRGRGGRGRGGARMKDERATLTQEELDAEMEDYQKGLGPSA